jgi:hypothetical protein
LGGLFFCVGGGWPGTNTGVRLRVVDERGSWKCITSFHDVRVGEITRKT